jgi:hypothetical protein
MATAGVINAQAARRFSATSSIPAISLVNFGEKFGPCPHIGDGDAEQRRLSIIKSYLLRGS